MGTPSFSPNRLRPRRSCLSTRRGSRCSTRGARGSAVGVAERRAPSCKAVRVRRWCMCLREILLTPVCIYLYIYLSINLSIHLRARLLAVGVAEGRALSCKAVRARRWCMCERDSFDYSVYLSIYLYIYLSVYLSICVQDYWVKFCKRLK